MFAESRSPSALQAATTLHRVEAKGTPPVWSVPGTPRISILYAKRPPCGQVFSGQGQTALGPPKRAAGLPTLTNRSIRAWWKIFCNAASEIQLERENND